MNMTDKVTELVKFILNEQYAIVADYIIHKRTKEKTEVRRYIIDSKKITFEDELNE